MMKTAGLWALSSLFALAGVGHFRLGVKDQFARIVPPYISSALGLSPMSIVYVSGACELVAALADSTSTPVDGDLSCAFPYCSVSSECVCCAESREVWGILHPVEPKTPDATCADRSRRLGRHSAMTLETFFHEKQSVWATWQSNNDGVEQNQKNDLHVVDIRSFFFVFGGTQKQQGEVKLL